MKRTALYLAMLAFCPVVRAQSSTRVLGQFEIGTNSGLGYQLPHILTGMALEQPLGKHWEAQGAFFWSPDHKYLTRDGNTVQVPVSGLFWPIPRLALTGGLEYVHLWTSQFNKTTWVPSAGMVLRFHWYEFPSRFYLSYAFPTGCQWGAGCPLQSSRLNGVEGFEESRIFPHWRIGMNGGWWRFAEQSNPLDPAAGRKWHNTGVFSLLVRYEFRAAKTDNLY